MSLLWPGSRCPACGRPIRWHDNVPVLAWLWLGGRCRDCRTAISPRYPLVELATAVAFLLLGWADVAGGASVAAVAEPQRLTAAAAGRFIYHALAVTGLATLGLIALDGQPIPRRLGLGLAVAGLAGAALLGAAHDAFVFSSTSPAPGTALAAPMEAAQAGGRAAALAALVASAGGAVAGLCLAAAWRAGHRIWPPANRSSHGVTLVFIVCGSFLGWRAAPSFLVMAAAALVGLALVRRRRRAGPPDAEDAAGLVAAGLVIAVVVLAAAGQGWASDILAGRWTGSLVGFGAAGCAVLACGLTVRGLARRA